MSWAFLFTLDLLGGVKMTPRLKLEPKVLET